MNLNIVYHLIMGVVAFILAWLFYSRERIVTSKVSRAIAVGGIVALGIVSWLNIYHVVIPKASSGIMWRVVLLLQVILVVSGGLALILGVTLGSDEAASVSRESASVSRRHKRLTITYGVLMLLLVPVVMLLVMSQRNLIMISGKEFSQITRLAPFVYGVPSIVWFVFWERRAGRIRKVLQSKYAVFLPPIPALTLIAFLYLPVWLRFWDLLAHGVLVYKAYVTVLLVGCGQVMTALSIWHLGCWLLLKKIDQSDYE